MKYLPQQAWKAQFRNSENFRNAEIRLSISWPAFNDLVLDLRLQSLLCLTEITKVRIQERTWMLRITRTANGEVIFKLSGQMSTENIGELETLFSAEASGRRIVLELHDLTLVDRDIVSFLKRSEANGIKLQNCPAYIRQWIKQQDERN